MAYGPKPLSRCREVTMMCKTDRHTRESTFKVWERVGLAGEDAPRRTLYEGPSWPGAYAAMTEASETISN